MPVLGYRSHLESTPVVRAKKDTSGACYMLGVFHHFGPYPVSRREVRVGHHISIEPGVRISAGGRQVRLDYFSFLENAAGVSQVHKHTMTTTSGSALRKAAPGHRTPLQQVGIHL